MQGERSLVRDGLEETVLSTRKAFQGTMRHDLINGVEEILGRRVTAFLSDNHTSPSVVPGAIQTAFPSRPSNAAPIYDSTSQSGCLRSRRF